MASADRPGGRTDRPLRVLILSADIGEGHDMPARILAADLVEQRPGTQVVIEDGLAAMGWLLNSTVRDGSRVMFRWLNWLFDAQYWLITHFPPTRWFAQTFLYRVGGAALLALVKAHDPDVVVSTYPGVTEVLGRARRRRRMDVPICSTITDLAGLRYWSHRGVDVHLLTHPESVPEVASIARRGGIHPARGLTSPSFYEPRDRAEARAAVDLPADARVILVSGGGWGVGDLASATRVALDIPGAHVVVLCGHNEVVRRRIEGRFKRERRARVLGFTNEMADLMASADALVHSSAGLTVLEAHLRGVPAISYGWGVAHIRANNEAYVRFGLAQVATTPAELRQALEHALAHPMEPDTSFAELPLAARLVLAAAATSADGTGARAQEAVDAQVRADVDRSATAR